MAPSIAALGPVTASPGPARSGPSAHYSSDVDSSDDDATTTTTWQRDAAVARPCQQALLRQPVAAVPGPDIQWHPSYETYRRRVVALNAAAGRSGQAKKTVPDGYPQQVEKPWVWSGDQMAADRYVVWLSDDDIAQIEDALSFFKGGLVR
jgi:hypothetical protein